MTIRPTACRMVRLVTLTVLLASCGGGDSPGHTNLLANRAGVGTSGSGSVQDIFGDTGRSGVARRVGSDRFLNLADGAPRDLVETSDTGAFTLNLVDVPIADAARAVLGNALKRNYAVAPGVNGSVTLQTSHPLSESDLLKTFTTVLELNGLALEVSGDLITVINRTGASQRIGRPGDGGVGPRVVAVPLQFIGTAEMVRLLEPIAGSTVKMQGIPGRNILLIAGTRDEINASLDAVNLFDVDVLKGKSTGLFPLRAAEPEAIVAELNTIFEAADGGSLQNVVTFVPSTRLNAVLVITSRANYLAEAERWIHDLDRTAGGSKRRPVVYNLQFRSAAELVPTLSEMLGEIGGDEANPNIDGQAKVVADGSKNAIVVWGNDTEQETLSRLIHTLDTTPVQVMLEATIAEVSLTDELKFGLRWYFEKGNLRGAFSDASNGAVAPTFPGLSFLFQGPSAAVALNALSSVTRVNIVSSPSLVVLDNQEARLQIGDEVPIAIQQVRDTTDPNAPVVNTISFRDTGIILTVKPRVSSGGVVVLDIEQEVSSVSNTTSSGIDSPTISQRKIKTSVVIGDGQTLALGGLIQDSRNRNNGQVPGLGNLPAVGGLFRNRADKVARTELLVLITPRVVRNGGEARSITDELRQRIGGADGLVRTGIAAPTVGHRIID